MSILLHPRFWSLVTRDERLMASTHRSRVISTKTLHSPAFIEEASRKGALPIPASCAVYAWDEDLIARWRNDAVSGRNFRLLQDKSGPAHVVATWHANETHSVVIFGAERMTGNDVAKVLQLPEVAACLDIPLSIVFVTAGDAGMFLTVQAKRFRHFFAASVALDTMTQDEIGIACQELSTHHPWHGITDSKQQQAVVKRLYGQTGGRNLQVFGALKLSENDEGLLFKEEELRKSLDDLFPTYNPRRG